MKHDFTVIMNIFTKNGVSLERLQALEKVVRAGTIAVAAKGDPNMQSLISRQIAELEAAMGVKLLDRSVKPYPPTGAARSLADCCTRFLDGVEQVVAEAAGEKMPIRLGAGELVIRELVIPWIGRQRKKKEPVTWVMSNLTSRRIQTDLAAEKLDIGISTGLSATGMVRVKHIADYGMKMLLPMGCRPDGSGWAKLTEFHIVVLEGSGGFRSFLAECERGNGFKLRIGAECTSYPQAVALAAAAGWAVFVPELWWRRNKDWAERTQELPGLGDYRHELRLGWNDRIAKRRPEISRLINQFGGGIGGSVRSRRT